MHMHMHMYVTCAGEEEVAVLVEGDSHHSVCEIEGLLDTVTMVNINVNIQHSRVVPKSHDTITNE